MSIELAYDRLVEGLNHGASQWWAFPSFLVTLVTVHFTLGLDAANYYISTVTVGFFFLFNYGQRKDSLANQLKHDAEITGLPSAQDELCGIEKETLSQLESRVEQN